MAVTKVTLATGLGEAVGVETFTTTLVTTEAMSFKSAFRVGGCSLRYVSHDVVLGLRIDTGGFTESAGTFAEDPKACLALSIPLARSTMEKDLVRVNVACYV